MTLVNDNNACMKFDGDVIDIIGGNNGTWAGTEAYATGIINQAASFNGSSRISASYNPILTRTTNHSVSLWFKANTMSAGTHSYLMCNANVGLSNRLGIVLYNVEGTKTIRVYYFNMGYTGRSGTLIENEWVHLVYTCTSSGVLSLYLNGVLQTGTQSDTVSTAGLFIGDKGDGSGYFNGLIDEFFIWNKVLSQDDVTNLYNEGNGLSFPFISDNVTRIGGAIINGYC
jgi:hypothetical protein